jgi:hypothetical protein
MVSRFLPRWRFAPGPMVVSLAAYVFLILALFALAAQAAGRLAGMVAHLAPVLTTSQEPAPKSAVHIAVPRTAAMSVPQARGRGSVVLAQGWSGFPGYAQDRSDWRERDRNRDAWRRGRDRDEDDRWRWRDSDDESDEDRRPRQSYGNTYRTVCVRLCDGYYWPISYATSADNLGRDRQKCESSCGSPARLYHGKTSGTETEDLEDLSGQPYHRLKTAFLYRTQYEPSCKCKAEPWSKEATDRHKMYALEAAKAKGDKVAAQELTQLKAAVEAGRLQKAGAAGTIQAAATEASDAAIAERRPRTSNPPPATGRMSLGVRADSPSSTGSRAPMRTWQGLNDSAP